MKSFFLCLPALTILGFLTGCMSTPQQHAEFVNSVNFSALDTFNYKHTLVTGMDFRQSEEIILEELSEQVIVSELVARGFSESSGDADFFAVVKWKKSVSSYADPFDHIDPYGEVLARRDNPANRFASRLHLTLEIYESSRGDLFWRKELPNIFDALQFTEKRVVDSLRLAIENFPDHIVKDPNLPSL